MRFKIGDVIVPPSNSLILTYEIMDIKEGKYYLDSYIKGKFRDTYREISETTLNEFKLLEEQEEDNQI